MHILLCQIHDFYYNHILEVIMEHVLKNYTSVFM